MSVISTLVVRLSTDYNPKGLRDAQRDFGQAGGKMQSVANEIGAVMSRAFAVGAVAALGKQVIQTAIEFESAFAGVRKTVDATEGQFKALEEGIRDMSRELPASAVEIAGVAEAAGQLGIETDAILGFSKVMIDLGETTNLSADQAATALARLANITGLPQDQFENLGSAVVDLGNNLATTEAEIVEMGLRLAGAGEQIGLTEAQILGMAGALSSVGIRAEQGGSAFSKVMIDIANAAATGSGDLVAFAEVAGMSAQDFKKAFETDAAGAFASFVEGLKRIESEGGNTLVALKDLGIEEVRMRDALLRAANAGDLLRTSMDLGTKAFRENTALVKEAEQRYKTTEAQLQKFKNQLADIGISLGSVVLPALVKATQATTDFFDVIRSFDGGSRSFLASLNTYAKSMRDIGVVNDMAYGSMLNLTAGVNILLGTYGEAEKETDKWKKAQQELGGVVDDILNDTLGPLNKEIETTGNVIKPTAEEIEKAAKRAEKFADAVRDSAASLPGFARSMRDLEQPTGEAAAKLKLIEENIRAADASMQDFILAFSNASAAMTPPLREAQVEMGKVKKGVEEMGEAVEQSFGDELLGGFSDILAQFGTDFNGLSRTIFGRSGEMANQVASFFGLGGPWGLAIAAGAEILGIELDRVFEGAVRAVRDMFSGIGDLLGFGGGGSSRPTFASIQQGILDAAFEELAAGMNKIGAISATLGADFDETSAAIRLLEDVIINLRSRGINETLPRFQALLKMLEDLRTGAETGTTALEAFNEASEMHRLRVRIEALQEKMENLIREGDIEAANRLRAEILQLQERLDALREAARQTGREFESITGTWVDFAHRVREATDRIFNQAIGFGGGGPSVSRPGGGTGITPGSGVQTILQHVMGIVEQEFLRLGELASAYSQMGVDFDLAGEQAGFLKRMITELAAEHGTNSEVVQALIKQYNELTKGQEKLTDEQVEQMRLEKERIRIQEWLNDRMARANAELAVTGDQADHTRSVMNALTEALIQLEQAGLGSSDLFADLMNQLKELEGAVKDTDLTPGGGGDGGGVPTTIQGDLNIEFPSEMIVSISGGEVIAAIEGHQFNDIAGLLEEIKAAILFTSDLPGNLEQKLEDFRVAFDSATNGTPGMSGPTTGSLLPAMTAPGATTSFAPGAAQVGAPGGGMAAPIVNLTALIEVDGESLMVPITKLMRGA